MNEKEEYLKTHADRMKDWPAEKREKILANIEKTWQSRKEGERMRQEYLDELCSKMVPKEKLKDGGLYIGPADEARGMWFGVWDSKKNTFHCYRYKFGWQPWELPYFGDVRETNQAGLAPMEEVEYKEELDKRE
jgi:hypothetical protein